MFWIRPGPTNQTPMAVSLIPSSVSGTRDTGDSPSPAHIPAASAVSPWTSQKRRLTDESRGSAEPPPPQPPVMIDVFFIRLKRV